MMPPAPRRARNHSAPSLCGMKDFPRARGLAAGFSFHKKERKIRYFFFAPSFGQPAQYFDPASKGAQAYAALARELIANNEKRR